MFYMHSYIYALCALTLTQYLVMVDANMSLHSTSLLLKVDQQDWHHSEELGYSAEFRCYPQLLSQNRILMNTPMLTFFMHLQV